MLVIIANNSLNYMTAIIFTAVFFTDNFFRCELLMNGCLTDHVTE